MTPVIIPLLCEIAPWPQSIQLWSETVWEYKQAGVAAGDISPQGSL